MTRTVETGQAGFHATVATSARSSRGGRRFGVALSHAINAARTTPDGAPTSSPATRSAAAQRVVGSGSGPAGSGAPADPVAAPALTAENAPPAGEPGGRTVPNPSSRPAHGPPSQDPVEPDNRTVPSAQDPAPGDARPPSVDNPLSPLAGPWPSTATTPGAAAVSTTSGPVPTADAGAGSGTRRNAAGAPVITAPGTATDGGAALNDQAPGTTADGGDPASDAPAPLASDTPTTGPGSTPTTDPTKAAPFPSSGAGADQPASPSGSPDPAAVAVGPPPMARGHAAEHVAKPPPPSDPARPNGPVAAPVTGSAGTATDPASADRGGAGPLHADPAIPLNASATPADGPGPITASPAPHPRSDTAPIDRVTVHPSTATAATAVRIESGTLGVIEVRVEAADGKGSHLSVLADRAEALDVLRRDDHALRAALDSAGVGGHAEIRYAIRELAMPDAVATDGDLASRGAGSSNSGGSDPGTGHLGGGGGGGSDASGERAPGRRAPLPAPAGRSIDGASSSGPVRSGGAAATPATIDITA